MMTAEPIPKLFLTSNTKNVKKKKVKQKNISLSTQHAVVSLVAEFPILLSHIGK